MKLEDHLKVLLCIRNIVNNSSRAKHNFEKMDSTKKILNIICYGFESLYTDAAPEKGARNSRLDLTESSTRSLQDDITKWDI